MEKNDYPNIDRRVRKTKALIRKTFTALLTEKELKDISVSELTQLADINRGTFYLHYRDIFDLFEQIEKEVWEDFTAIIEKHKVYDQASLSLILLELFKYIAADSDIFIAILKTKESTFLDQFIATSRPKNKKEWSRLVRGGNEEDYEYYYSFIAFGCVAILKRWFEGGMKESPQYMAKLAEQLMANCAKIE
jgi:AcrR family transcriptional regulator